MIRNAWHNRGIIPHQGTQQRTQQHTHWFLSHSNHMTYTCKIQIFPFTSEGTVGGWWQEDTLLTLHTRLSLSGTPSSAQTYCFAIFKCLFKCTKVDGKSDFADFLTALLCVMSVHTGSANIVPTREYPTYFLPHFHKISNNKKYHHFRISFTSPGTERMLTQQKSYCQDSRLPPHMELKGLSDERQWNLYEPMCSDEHLYAITLKPINLKPKKKG